MKRKSIKEATGASSAGKFKVPIVLAPQLWKDRELGPFVEPVYHYKNAELAYEEADGDFKESFEERQHKEQLTDKVAEVDRYLKQFYMYQNDDEGSSIGQTENEPMDDIESKLVKEDLAVWFGTKKKPKGSAQPKGPWVNICRKDEKGKHPPCGRSKATEKGYPKCRAVHVASKMTDSQKRSACQQKRKAEKTHSKAGTGNKPKMVSYKPKGESTMKETIRKVLKEYYDRDQLYVKNILLKRLDLYDAPSEIKKIVRGLPTIPCENNQGEKTLCVKIPEVVYVYLQGRY